MIKNCIILLTFAISLLFCLGCKDEELFLPDHYLINLSQIDVINPDNNAINQPVEVNLAWSITNPANEQIYYDVYLGKSNPPTTKISSLQTTTSYYISTLSENTTYYWQVCAEYANNNNITNGPVWKFTTETYPLNPPVLTSPSNAATINSTSPTFSWNSVNGASRYGLQVSTSSVFADYVYNQYQIVGTSKQVIGLKNSTKYYWRVYAEGTTGISNWSTIWSFTITDATPCQGIISVGYSGQTYNTVEIAYQCWLKENLNVGTRINSSEDQTENNNIEKYCYNDNPNNCSTYGGLYQWNEIMQYSTTEGTRGICPNGWHIPTYTEFETLAVAVSNNSNALKAVGQGSGNGVGTNTSGFSALLAGSSDYDGTFRGLGINTNFWSSSEWINVASVKHDFQLYNSDSQIGFGGSTSNGYSVRCLKD
ncbi:MAG: hypothetical protein M0P61_05905 [Ignavibacteriaceae bacterium]|jgi:uncharacterized protein (TIGR02145 family)|nr:hypothetical protein [Ignavibacteriaceae bacterium]